MALEAYSYKRGGDLFVAVNFPVIDINSCFVFQLLTVLRFTGMHKRNRRTEIIWFSIIFQAMEILEN